MMHRRTKALDPVRDRSRSTDEAWDVRKHACTNARAHAHMGQRRGVRSANDARCTIPHTVQVDHVCRIQDETLRDIVHCTLDISPA